MEILSPSLVLLSYGSLYLAIISLWVPRKSAFQIWHLFLIISIILALFSHQIKLIGLIPVILLPIAIYYSQIRKTNIPIKAISFVFAILLSVGLGAHLFPGFDNLKILNQVYISQDAVPYTMYLNFDKVLVGLFILGITHQMISRRNDWISLFKKTLPTMVVVILIVVLLALALQFVRFDPKLSNHLLIWMITNLLFVSVAEEAFFRGFLQKNFSRWLEKISLGHYIAILGVSILFGLVHFAGGIKYVLLATVAGIGYGWIYDKTKRTEASILTHFGLNLTHFLLFTYPMLASAL